MFTTSSIKFRPSDKRKAAINRPPLELLDNVHSNKQNNAQRRDFQGVRAGEI